MSQLLKTDKREDDVTIIVEFEGRSEADRASVADIITSGKVRA